MFRQWDVRLFALTAVLAVSPWCHADEPPKQWAVLVGVKTHDVAAYNTLHFTVNDVALVAQTLKERAGVPNRQILQMTDDSSVERQPTLGNLREQVPPFLKKAGEDDRVVVFFSGHGVLRDGQTYLVPRDFNAENAARTGLPMDEVRQMLADCPARVKFLILDCCHAAGSEKGTEEHTLPAEAVARALRLSEKPVPGCVVLASCRAEEKSWEWTERKHGVFTYWLCRALEGAAANDDGKITITKVNEYVEERVRETTKQEQPAVQTPLLFGRLQGSPVVLTLRPEPPETLCRRLGEHLDLEVRRREHKIKKVGVLEFQEPLRRAQGLAGTTLPAYCAEQVRRSLASLAADGYEVVDAEQMKSVAKDLSVEALRDRRAMRQLRERAGGLDAIVTGELRRRDDTLHLECELMSVPDCKSLVKPSGVLPLSEDLIPDVTGDPTLDNDSPFRVELYTVLVKPGETITEDTPRRKKEFRRLTAEDDRGHEKKHAEFVVNAREGEIFEIHMTNKSDEDVAMVLLVDGLNTLGQERARLETARPWVLAAKTKYAVEGWTFDPKTPGGDYVIRRFQFVDVTKSVAGRQTFGESIGLITAAFYAEKRVRPAVGTPRLSPILGGGEGPEEKRKLETKKFNTGRLLGVVQIRYVDERDLKK